MTALPQNPVVVILVNENREVVAMATNVSPDLNIVTTRNPERFAKEALGKPFKSDEGELEYDPVPSSK